MIEFDDSDFVKYIAGSTVKPYVPTDLVSYPRGFITNRLTQTEPTYYADTTHTDQTEQQHNTQDMAISDAKVVKVEETVISHQDSGSCHSQITTKDTAMSHANETPQVELEEMTVIPDQIPHNIAPSTHTQVAEHSSLRNRRNMSKMDKIAARKELRRNRNLTRKPGRDIKNLIRERVDQALPKRIAMGPQRCSQCLVELTEPSDLESDLSAVVRPVKKSLCLGCLRFRRYLKKTKYPEQVIKWLVADIMESYPAPKTNLGQGEASACVQNAVANLLHRCVGRRKKIGLENSQHFIQSVSRQKTHRCAITGQRIYLCLKPSTRPELYDHPPWALAVSYRDPLWHPDSAKEMETICEAFSQVKLNSCTNEEVMRWFNQFKTCLLRF